MKVTFLTTDGIRKKLLQLMDDFDEFFWAVAWGSDGPLADRLLANKRKMRKVLIGVHFSQTDPRFLWRLSGNPTARVAAADGSGIFHPKAYFFQSGANAATIIGSANFTRSGTTRNIEAAILIEGGSDEGPLRSTRTMIERQWSLGWQIDPAFLSSYELQFAANRRARQKLLKPLRLRPTTKNPFNPNLLTMTWRDFTQRINEAPREEIDNHLTLLRRANLMLSGNRAFSELTLDERKAIAGVIGPRERLGTGLDDVDWRRFGSMFGAGTFRNRIAVNDHNLSNALDCIPPKGEIDQEDYEAFIEHFRRAFEESERTGRYPTSSRLLAMKRPDYFLCVDSKNVRKLSADLGFSRTTLTHSRYWTEVVEPIIQSKWWQSRRPGGHAGQIWDSRAAMLDVLYYEPS